MDIHVAKGFNQAQSDEHKRNWDDEKWRKVIAFSAASAVLSANATAVTVADN